MAASFFDGLPDELLSKIAQEVSDVSPLSLLKLSPVCRRFHGIVDDILFADVTHKVAPYLNGRGSLFSNTEALVNFFRCRPDVLKKIRMLRIIGMGYDDLDDRREPGVLGSGDGWFEGKFHDDRTLDEMDGLAPFVSKMPGLKSLVYDIPSPTPKVLFNQLKCMSEDITYHIRNMCEERAYGGTSTHIFDEIHGYHARLVSLSIPACCMSGETAQLIAAVTRSLQGCRKLRHLFLKRFRYVDFGCDSIVKKMTEVMAIAGINKPLNLHSLTLDGFCAWSPDDSHLLNLINWGTLRKFSLSVKEMVDPPNNVLVLPSMPSLRSFELTLSRVFCDPSTLYPLRNFLLDCDNLEELVLFGATEIVEDAVILHLGSRLRTLKLHHYDFDGCRPILSIHRIVRLRMFCSNITRLGSDLPQHETYPELNDYTMETLFGFLARGFPFLQHLELNYFFDVDNGDFVGPDLRTTRARAAELWFDLRARFQTSKAEALGIPFASVIPSLNALDISRGSVPLLITLEHDAMEVHYRLKFQLRPHEHRDLPPNTVVIRCVELDTRLYWELLRNPRSPSGYWNARCPIDLADGITPQVDSQVYGLMNDDDYTLTWDEENESWASIEKLRMWPEGLGFDDVKEKFRPAWIGKMIENPGWKGLDTTLRVRGSKEWEGMGTVYDCPPAR